MDETHPTQPPTETAAASSSVKLPPFTPIDAPIWFKRAEVQFRIHNVSQSRRADHVLASLPPEVFSQIAAFTDNYEMVAYDALKTHLLETLTPSATQRAAKIRQLSTQPLGQQKATDAWTENHALATLDPPIDMLKEKFLARLPAHVRSTLPKESQTDTTILAKQAQELIEAHSSTNNLHAFHAENDEPDEEPAVAVKYLPPKQILSLIHI